MHIGLASRLRDVAFGVCRAVWYAPVSTTVHPGTRSSALRPRKALLGSESCLGRKRLCENHRGAAQPRMRREDLTLCLLTREEFTEEYEEQVWHICRADEPNWRRLFLTAEDQRVSPLVHHNLDVSSSLLPLVPPAVRSDFKRAHIHNVLKKKEAFRTLVTLARCCADNGVDPLLVKGGALAFFVQRWPWSLISGDLDVVLRAQPGGVTGANVEAVVRFAEHYNHSRSHLSEHIEYELDGHHDVSMNRVLRISSQDYWRAAQCVEIDGSPLFILSPEMMLIAACINACRKRYFYLKALHDIATLCHNHPGLDWREIVMRSQLYRADAIVYTALLATQTTLGCPVPPEVWHYFSFSRVRRAGIEQMVALLWKYGSLDALSAERGAIFGRKLSAPLLLTYLSYRMDTLGTKLNEVMSAWRNPHPAKPVDDGRYGSVRLPHQ